MKIIALGSNIPFKNLSPIEIIEKTYQILKIIILKLLKNLIFINLKHIQINQILFFIIQHCLLKQN